MNNPTGLSREKIGKLFGENENQNLTKFELPDVGRVLR